MDQGSRSAQDPEDRGERLARLYGRARREGPGALIEGLNDRSLWRLMEAPAQDAAIAEAARRLGSAFAHTDTRIHRCAGLAHRLGAFRHLATGAPMMLIPGGDFIMGGLQGTGFPTHLFGYDDPGFHALPAHPCRIERPFLLGARPLLQGEAPDLTVPRGARSPELPVHDVSWQAARAWLERLGDGLRLPSEAEWEYAARAGTETSFYWGEWMDEDWVWTFRNNDRLRDPQEHAERANSFGLIDMLGNLPEWCEDAWIENYEGGPSNQEPRRDGDDQLRVCRGGTREPWTLHCAHRMWEDAHDPDDVGLRLARSLPEG